MTINRVKVERAATFMKYFASIVSLPKTLIWNKIMFRVSNSLNFAELVEIELMKSIYKKVYQYYFLYPLHRCLL